MGLRSVLQSKDRFLLPRLPLSKFVPFEIVTKIFFFGSFLLLAWNTIRRYLLDCSLPVLATNSSIIFLLFTLGLGPGLIVNTILKDRWGRARPAQIREFGGSRRFTKAFVMSDQCRRNCSFVSGDAAMGYYGLAFAFVARRRRVIIASAGLLAGTTIGLIRIAQGAHFLSDVMLAGVFIFLIAWLLYASIRQVRLWGERLRRQLNGSSLLKPKSQ